MKEIMVEGYKVLVKNAEGGRFVMTVPELPGIVGQADNEREIVPETRRLIGAYLIALVKKPMQKPAGAEERAGQDESKAKIKR